MAIIQGKFLRGSIAGYAFRKVGDRNIIQSKPVKVRQTQATRESGAEFGLSSTAGKMLRIAFEDLYGDDHDGRMMNRLVKSLSEVLRSDRERPRGYREFCGGDVSRLEGFAFNAAAPMGSLWKVKPEAEMDASGRIKVHIPEFNPVKDLKFPSDSDLCLLQVSVIAFDFKNRRYKELGTEGLEVAIARGLQPVREWVFETDVPQGCLLLAGLSLKFCKMSRGGREPVREHVRFHTSQIIGAFVRPERETPYTEPVKRIAESVHSTGAVDTGWRMPEFNSMAYTKLREQAMKRAVKEAEGKAEGKAGSKTQVAEGKRKPDKDGWIAG